MTSESGSTSTPRRVKGKQMSRKCQDALAQHLEQAQSDRHRADVEWIKDKCIASHSLALAVRSFIEA
eukprot:14196394-Alexandrium_andersonii.AAC.1